ncbi:helix-turn-helix transcriptional regulator [Lactococcus garvieae]|uniref:helix-turn-helix domain-containing protein n=1 Tax=Lactococcus garvieae TaxID=1363 RepID=UPI0030D1E0E6
MTKTKLQIMREKKGLSEADLSIKICEILGTTNPLWLGFALISYEIGKTKITFSDMFFEAAAQALGCSVDELVEE